MVVPLCLWGFSLSRTPYYTSTYTFPILPTILNSYSRAPKLCKYSQLVIRFYHCIVPYLYNIFLSVIYCCIIDNPQINNLKEQKTLIISQSSQESGIWEWLSSDSISQFFMRICQLGMQSSDILSGVEGYILRMAYPHGWQVNFGCCRRYHFLVPCTSSRTTWVSSWHGSWIPPEWVI